MSTLRANVIDSAVNTEFKDTVTANGDKQWVDTYGVIKTNRNTIAEDVTHQGQIDLTLKMPKQTVILEFKIGNKDASQKALAQIKAKQYANKYLVDNKPIYLIGIGFNSNTRNVNGLCWEVIKNNA